jgi:hypothetical protein
LDRLFNKKMKEKANLLSGQIRSRVTDRIRGTKGTITLLVILTATWSSLFPVSTIKL